MFSVSHLCPVNAGVKIHNEWRLAALKPPPWRNVDNDFEDYLAKVSCTPLTLQQLARIRIRDRVIWNQRTRPQPKRWPHLDGSVLKYALAQLGLPALLLSYLYDFYDVPELTDDISDIRNQLYVSSLMYNPSIENFQREQFQTIISINQ